MGYGIGSSGALTAAAFDRYFKATPNIDLHSLRNVLAQIESYFHGKSSGIDALAIYLNQGLQINSEDILNVCDIKWEFLKRHFFLVDTLNDRKASNLIKIYNSEIRNSIDLDGLKQKVSMAIQGVLVQDAEQIDAAIKPISELQWESFRPMIPSSVESLWQTGLSSGNFTLKLLGAGGGGYLLGFSRDLKLLPENEKIIFF